MGQVFFSFHLPRFSTVFPNQDSVKESSTNLPSIKALQLDRQKKKIKHFNLSMVTAFSYIFTSVSFGFFTFNLIIEEGIIKLKCCLLLYSIAYYKLNIKLNIQDSYYYTRQQNLQSILQNPPPQNTSIGYRRQPPPAVVNPTYFSRFVPFFLLFLFSF